ncbi:hypothetical protein EMIT0P2_50022 [Pseudomonas sp. IT-P2]
MAALAPAPAMVPPVASTTTLASLAWVSASFAWRAVGRSRRRAKAPGTKLFKADVIIFLSSSETVLMQVHLDAPRADLNARGAGREQDLYQSYCA